VTYEEALDRLRATALSDGDARVVAAHFAEAERRGKPGHGFARVAFVEGLVLPPAGRPEKVSSEGTVDRWHGRGAIGYVVVRAIVDDLLAGAPASARLVIAESCFPTGALGLWARELAEAGLVAVITATSPRRLPPPGGGPPLTGTNPLAIAVPSSDGRPIVADVAMSAVTWGDVLAGRRRAEELVPFGGEQAHKAFALAVGLELLVAALAGAEHGLVLLAVPAAHDPVPAFRDLAAGIRLPGDG
jgi:LDH2 family malate/lactate/ureidoglycolate dehydrogenase